MEIKILGTRAEIKVKQPLHSKHTAVLCDQKIMLDFGEEEFLKERPAAVFISHLHPDHAFFKNKPVKSELEKFPIYVPENPYHLKYLKVIKAKETIHAEGYKVVSIPVRHSLKVKSLGYIIEKNSKRIFFSGDIADMEEKYRKKLGRLDLVITEGSFIRKGGLLRRDQEGKVSGHAGIPDLVQMFEPYTHHIVIIHLGSWFMKDVKKGKEKIQRLGNKKLTVEAAFDGQIIEV